MARSAMLQHVLVGFIFFVNLAFAEEVTVAVDRTQFQHGNSWRWLYSEKSDDGNWKPYFVENYTVVESVGDRVVIEMKSAPAFSQKRSAHHRFILDFKKCVKASLDPRFKNFTVEFYTKSLGPNWELVSRSHDGKVFREKFNCAAPFPNQRIVHEETTFESQSFVVFGMLSNPPQAHSFYFLNHPSLKGVAARKLFSPQGKYKFELMDYRSQMSFVRVLDI